MAKRNIISLEEAAVPAQPSQWPSKSRLNETILKGFHRFVIGAGLSVSHGQMTYAASPEGWVDLPSGEDWYRPMIDAGILKEHFDEPQT